MTDLLIATNNAGKVREFQELFAGLNLRLVAPSTLGLKLEVEENGTTYRENARLKAEAFARASGLLTLADDSGLEVDALEGEPGLRSSRYAGAGAGDAERVRFLLAKLEGVPWEKRTARFRCVIALAALSAEPHFFEGTCEGVIALEPRGGQGFGYDPIFYFPEYRLTMAELDPALKNRISHRGRAAAEAARFLSQL